MNIEYMKRLVGDVQARGGEFSVWAEMSSAEAVASLGLRSHVTATWPHSTPGSGERAVRGGRSRSPASRSWPASDLSVCCVPKVDGEPRVGQSSSPAAPRARASPGGTQKPGELPL